LASKKSNIRVYVHQLLLQIINAPITPGTHAHNVRRKTIIIEPQPLSITAKGGKIMQSITRKIDIIQFFMDNNKTLKVLLSYGIS
jgi:hypothetical protein